MGSRDTKHASKRYYRWIGVKYQLIGLFSYDSNMSSLSTIIKEYLIQAALTRLKDFIPEDIGIPIEITLGVMVAMYCLYESYREPPRRPDNVETTV